MSSTQQDAKLLDLEKRAKVQTGPLVPLLPAKPSKRQLPQLPPRASAAPFGAQRLGWRLDSHIIPAAFPRSTRGSTQHPAPGPEKPAAAGATRVKVDANAVYEQMLTAQVEAHQRQVDVQNKQELEDQEQLYLAVNRYRPKKRREGGQQGLTLVFAHANGFHKEIWEPTMADLLDQLEDPSQPQALPVDEIWALDAVNQGDSGVLNEAVLGSSFNWADHGRDILNFVISYLDSPTSIEPSSTELPDLHADSSLLALDTGRRAEGASSPPLRLWRDRLIVGIGHSLGGGGMAFASSASPFLFSSIIFCDPVLPWPTLDRSVRGLTTGAIVRREEWSSTEEAREGFLKKAFFRQWDSRVLDSYCTHGVKAVASGGAALKTRARDEALVFCDPMAVAARRACARLELLPTSLPVHFVFADFKRSVLNEELIEQMLTLVPHATTARVAGAGHLVAQEDPLATAKEIARCLRRNYPARSEAKL